MTPPLKYIIIYIFFFLCGFFLFVVRVFVELREQVQEQSDIGEHVINIEFREVAIETEQTGEQAQDDDELNLKRKGTK